MVVYNDSDSYSENFETIPELSGVNIEYRAYPLPRISASIDVGEGR